MWRCWEGPIVVIIWSTIYFTFVPIFSIYVIIKAIVDVLCICRSCYAGKCSQRCKYNITQCMNCASFNLCCFNPIQTFHLIHIFYKIKAPKSFIDFLMQLQIGVRISLEKKHPEKFIYRFWWKFYRIMELICLLAILTTA